jgi:hypothetical protein
MLDAGQNAAAATTINTVACHPRLRLTFIMLHVAKTISKGTNGVAKAAPAF